MSRGLEIEGWRDSGREGKRETQEREKGNVGRREERDDRGKSQKKKGTQE